MSQVGETIPGPRGVLTSARVTHETGDVDDLAAASPASQTAAVDELCRMAAVDEAFVLSTCNRVEAYVVSPDADAGRDALDAVFADAPASALVRAGHEESLRHLLRVACGLDSVVLGEDQIIGQVRTAYEDARRVDGIGPMLGTAVTKAIHVGERARTETAINEGIVSLGSAAARVANREIGVEGQRALVVGAGEMGALAARCLADRGATEVVVANRTVDHAERVVDQLDAEGNAVGLSALDAVTRETAIVVTATGSTDPVLDRDQLGDREQVVIDLGQPRDVEPAVRSLPTVTVYDLDDLEAITRETREVRTSAAAEVEAIVDAEFRQLLDHYKRRRADEVIGAMYQSAERLKTRELETAYARLEETGSFTEDQREIVDAMADALVGQLLAAPTKSLRDAAADDDWETITTALALFDPEFGPDSPRQSEPRVDETVVEEPIGVSDDD